MHYDETMVSLPPLQFIAHQEETNAGTRQHQWAAKFENHLFAINIGNDARKKALSLHYAGHYAGH